MPRTIRVLLADDSTTVRRLLTETLSSEPTLEVCHAATDGRDLLDHYAEVRPDVILLDAQMPVMSGSETTIALRRIDPQIPIIMMSSLTAPCASATLESLTNGATDFVVKPAPAGQVQAAVVRLQRELVPKLKFWSHSSGAFSKPSEPMRPSISEDWNSTVDLAVVIASSSGVGLLSEFARTIPDSFSVPAVVVPCLPSVFQTMLRDRMSRSCPRPLRDVSFDDCLMPSNLVMASAARPLLLERHEKGFHVRPDSRAKSDEFSPGERLLSSIANQENVRVLVIHFGTPDSAMIRQMRQICERGGHVICLPFGFCVNQHFDAATEATNPFTSALTVRDLTEELSRVVQTKQPMPMRL